MAVEERMVEQQLRCRLPATFRHPIPSPASRDRPSTRHERPRAFSVRFHRPVGMRAMMRRRSDRLTRCPSLRNSSGSISRAGSARHVFSIVLVSTRLFILLFFPVHSRVPRTSPVSRFTSTVDKAEHSIELSPSPRSFRIVLGEVRDVLIDAHLRFMALRGAPDCFHTSRASTLRRDRPVRPRDGGAHVPSTFEVSVLNAA